MKEKRKRAARQMGLRPPDPAPAPAAAGMDCWRQADQGELVADMS